MFKNIYMLNKYRFKINYKLSGGSLSFVALKSNDLDQAKFLINIADINSYDKLGNKYLFYAINSGKLEIVKLLIEKGANVNDVNINGKTALHAAAEAGKLEIVKYFIDYINDTDI